VHSHLICVVHRICSIVPHLRICSIEHRRISKVRNLNMGPGGARAGERPTFSVSRSLDKDRNLRISEMHGNQFFPFCGVCTTRSHSIQSFPHMSQPQTSTVSGLSPAAHERFQTVCHAASNVQRLSTSSTRSPATPACSRAASRARMLGSPLPAPADSSTSSSSPSSEDA
jgi:hypothetical protein